MYLPRVICEINERIEFESRAPDRLVPRILASVEIIESPVAIAQIAADSVANLRSFIAVSPNLPSLSIRKNPMAISKPIVEKLAARDKNLLIANKFIVR